MHEHFDAAGNKTGHTVVTRESLWDDSSRARAMRLHDYERSICTCGCGLPYAVSHNPKTPLVVDSQVCYAQRTLTDIRERETEQHKDDQTWSMGRHHFVYVPTDEQIEQMLQEREQRQREREDQA